ncbi:MAG: hypothetical protein IKN84_00805 [Bacteroidales bacterium]|nr:hypothetical protein [Bacteroidales bacterium]
MKAKKPVKKVRKITVSLCERDFEKITELARQQNVVRPLVAKRLLHEQLATIEIAKRQSDSKNQLGLFDSLQINIFNETSKTEE